MVKKNIISQKIVKIDSNTDTFKELYDVITKDLVSITRSVHVYYVGEINNKWIYVEEGLYDEMKFFDLDEYTPYDVIQKYNYIKNLQLNVPVTIYRYYQGNYLGTVNYIWKVPVRSDHRSETENARIIAAINENLPKYYTRQMRKNALKENTPAVDDRRQQEILYMPIAISIKLILGKEKEMIYKFIIVIKI
uniref:Uncharacterized protein n=1 Tax=Rhizophagus irregularis (strain DAOM 181602 / DAOM 197198 / MUCL 43194) TaxID=747089 RepID=U9TRZ8_RHIID